MQELIKQEQFEIEILDRLNTCKLLNTLVFGGGTMLRLCYGLPRFSVDLDFWTTDKTDAKKIFKEILRCLNLYTVRDAKDKYHTMLFELKTRTYPRALKIEIRKEKKILFPERSIAFSNFSNTQVVLNSIPLKEMMYSKIEALIDRKEIRDAFDIEFLLRKGIEIEATETELREAKSVILSFKKNDYTSKLGALLANEERKYYTSENFKFLLMTLNEKLNPSQLR